MARKRMVTRTIDVNYVDVMIVNIEEQSFDTVKMKFFSLPDGMNDEKYLKLAAVRCEPGYIPVKVMGAYTESHIYGMPEEIFLQYAEDMGTER